MIPIDLTILKWAVFTDDRKYRYLLWRIWSKTQKPLLFIGLNPSTATELKDDPTITRIIKRAYNAGFGGLIMANLYAFIATNPKLLLGNGDFVGAENDDYIKQSIKLSAKTVCGWGSFKPVKNRAIEVLKMIPEPYCLGINSDGQPKHPLYVSYKTPIIKYPHN
jgi:hypothetical protein